MKTIFTLFLGVGLCAVAAAQATFSLADKNGNNYTNSAVINTGSALVTFPNDEPLKWRGYLTNTGSSTVRALVKRRMLNVPPTSENQFCWSVQCYAPITNQATDTILLAAGATDSSFYSYFFPGGTNGIFTIQYVFFNADNPNDSIYANVTYDVSGGSSSIQETGGSAGHLGAPYPNPAKSQTRIDYSLQTGKGSLALYDLSGALVQEIDLNAGKGTVVLDVKGLHSGMYFYSLKNHTGVLATGRLLVSQ